MSLSDLKKSTDGKVKKKKFTIDEFISDAENYARGEPEIVSSDPNNKLNLRQAIAAAKNHVERKKTANVERVPFRHATFTLSEDAIEQLQELAADTQLAKSHIIRILIDELCNKDQKDKLRKLLDSHIG